MLATAGNLSVVNAYLGPFLNSYQKWLVEKNSGVLPDALSILNEMDCMKIFPSDRQLFLSCLSFSNSLMTAAGGQVEHVQVSYQDHVLHTTLDVGQAALVQRYISSVGLAATSKPKRSSPIISTWSFIDKESFMKYEGDGNPVLHIRSANRTDDTGEVSEAVRAPLKLLLYKCDSLLVMLLLRGDEDDVQRENALRSRLLQIVLQSSKSLSSSCSRTLASANGWHVPGYRYLFVDGMNLVTRASPKEKVATLSKDSLAFACKLRSELDNQARFPDQIEQEVMGCIHEETPVGVLVFRRSARRYVPKAIITTHGYLSGGQMIGSSLLCWRSLRRRWQRQPRPLRTSRSRSIKVSSPQIS
eukprot:scaffold175_cov414-Prasinococcus_capsulatus_cf.AAC.51